MKVEKDTLIRNLDPDTISIINKSLIEKIGSIEKGKESTCDVMTLKYIVVALHDLKELIRNEQ